MTGCEVPIYLIQIIVKVVDVANHIMQGSGFLYRMQSLKIQGLQIQDDYCQYYPLRSTLLGVK